MKQDMVYLDGVLTEAEKVDPARCRFVGMWRVPFGPFEKVTADLMCPCQTILQTREQVITHYLRGHFDVPQYIRSAPSNALCVWLDSDAFYILMQAYRHAPLTEQFKVVSVFEEIKRAILERARA